MPDTDIVARLEECLVKIDGLPIPPIGGEGIKIDLPYRLSDLLRDAKAEIEHLRSLAGAVSDGKSFADIAGRQTVQFEDEGPQRS